MTDHELSKVRERLAANLAALRKSCATGRRLAERAAERFRLMSDSLPRGDDEPGPSTAELREWLNVVNGQLESVSHAGTTLESVVRHIDTMREESIRSCNDAADLARFVVMMEPKR
jgi:hypothetical protein